MASLADITGIYLFKLFGADGLADNTFWVTVLGVLFIVAMTWICYIGIEVSARTQYFLLAMEVIALFTFAAVALLRVYFGHPAGAIHPSLSWLNPFAIHDIHAFTAGILLAIFIYWGWDTAVTVNEEADDTTETPGRAALLSTLALVGIYVVVSVAAQAFHGTKALEDQDDVLAVLAKDVLGPLSKVLIIAVLTSSAASTQTTILPTARTTLSMAAKGAFPKYFARIHPRYLTPTTSTIWMGAISILWYVGLTIGSQNVLADSLDALGLMIAFYYGLTGFVCVIFYRHQLFRSAKNFLLMGLIPLVGGVFLLWAMVKSGIDYAKPENSESGSSWFGLGPPLVIGAASMLLGIVLMVIQQIRHPAFFRRKLEVAPEEGIEAPGALPGEVGLVTE
jgi:amino acid transporter